MHQDPFVFIHPRGTRRVLLFGTIIFGLVFMLYCVASLNDLEYLPHAIGFGFLSFCVTGLYISVNSYKIIISEQKIATSRFNRQMSLQWSMVESIGSTMCGDLIIRSASEKMTISKQVESYVEIVETIRKKRSDLFEGKRDFGNGTGSFIFAVCVFGSIALAIVRLLQDDGGTAESIFIIALGFLAVGFVVTRITKITLESGKITLTRLVDNRVIGVDKIDDIRFVKRHLRYTTYYYPVIILLKDGKEIELNDIKIGTPILYGYLKTWLMNIKNNY